MSQPFSTYNGWKSALPLHCATKGQLTDWLTHWLLVWLLFELKETEIITPWLSNTHSSLHLFQSVCCLMHNAGAPKAIRTLVTVPNNISCVSEWHTDAVVQWTSQSNTIYQHAFISVNSISCCRRGALSLLQLFDGDRQIKFDSLLCTRTCKKKQEQLDRAYAFTLREHVIDLGWCWHIDRKPQPSYCGNIANPHYHINQHKLVIDTMTQCPPAWRVTIQVISPAPSPQNTPVWSAFKCPTSSNRVLLSLVHLVIAIPNEQRLATVLSLEGAGQTIKV